MFSQAVEGKLSRGALSSRTSQELIYRAWSYPIMLRRHLHLISERLIAAGAELPKVTETGGDGTRRRQKRHFIGASSTEAP